MKKKVLQAVAVIAISCATFLAAGRLSAASGYEGDFYIITSVNLRMHELFLKAPTEVTELMLVNDKTAFFDQQGKHLTFKDLRAGDTVYVVSDRGSTKGEPVAARIQMGPMTAEILHGRYLNYK